MTFLMEGMYVPSFQEKVHMTRFCAPATVSGQKKRPLRSPLPAGYEPML